MELCPLFACQSHCHAHGEHMLTEHCEHDTFIALCVQNLCVHMHIQIELTLASFMLQGVLSWLPCCVLSRVNISFGVHWVPQNIPLKVIILNHDEHLVNLEFGQSCCIVDLCQHSCSTTKICVGLILWFMFHDTHSTLILVVQS